MKTRKFCPRCATLLVKSKIEGYVFYCHECQEDFYRFEALKVCDINLVKILRQYRENLRDKK